jgi:hypothetical protein
MENRPLSRSAAVCAEHQPQRARLSNRVIGIPKCGCLPTLLRLASEAQSRPGLLGRRAGRAAGLPTTDKNQPGIKVNQVKSR